MIELVFIGAFVLEVFFSVLCIGGIISDYIFPHINTLTRWIDTLPMMNDLEEDVIEVEDDDILSFVTEENDCA